MSNRENFQPTEQNTAAAIHRLANLETRLAATVYEETSTGELSGLRQDADLYVGEAPRKQLINEPNDVVVTARLGMKHIVDGMVTINTRSDSHPRGSESSLKRTIKKRAPDEDERAVHVSATGSTVSASVTENDRLVISIDPKDPEDLVVIRAAAARMVRQARRTRHQKQDWIKSNTERLKEQKVDNFPDFADM
jgi:hypothetical protein